MLQVSTGGVDASLNPAFNITFTLNEPCDPPTSLTSPGYTDQTYAIGAVDQSYLVPDFVVEPSFCQVDYTYPAETTFADDNAA